MFNSSGEAKTSGQPRLLLTAAVPASFEAIAAGYDVSEISKYLDFINVMTYDFHGQWERSVGHNSPLFPLESASSHQKKLTVVSGVERINIFEIRQSESCVISTLKGYGLGSNVLSRLEKVSCWSRSMCQVKQKMFVLVFNRVPRLWGVCCV